MTDIPDPGTGRTPGIVLTPDEVREVIEWGHADEGYALEYGGIRSNAELINDLQRRLDEATR